MSGLLPMVSCENAKFCCRTCLGSLDQNAISYVDLSQNVQIVELIHKNVGNAGVLEDKFPQFVCYYCHLKLQELAQFCQKAKLSFETLMGMCQVDQRVENMSRSQNQKNVFAEMDMDLDLELQTLLDISHSFSEEPSTDQLSHCLNDNNTLCILDNQLISLPCIVSDIPVVQNLIDRNTGNVIELANIETSDTSANIMQLPCNVLENSINSRGYEAVPMAVSSSVQQQGLNGNAALQPNVLTYAECSGSSSNTNTIIDGSIAHNSLQNNKITSQMANNSATNLIEQHKALNLLPAATAPAQQQHQNSLQPMANMHISQHVTPVNTAENAAVLDIDYGFASMADSSSERFVAHSNGFAETNLSLHTLTELTPPGSDRSLTSDHADTQCFSTSAVANDYSDESIEPENTPNPKIAAEEVAAESPSSAAKTAQSTTSSSAKSNGKDNLFRCIDCNKRFLHKHTYDAHMLRVHEGTNRPYACTECSKTYKTCSALKYHTQVAHQQVDQSFPCSECGKTYKTEPSLKSHIAVIHKGQKREKNHVCDICPAAFPTASLLDIHKKAKHSETGDSEFKCHVCEKVCQTPTNLKYHMERMHLDVKNFICDVCGAGFPKNFMLISHKSRRHISEEDKPVCEYCNKKLWSKEHYDKHVQTVHLKLRPYICDICGEGFGDARTLKHHTYRHTGEKPYNCDQCGTSFRQLKALNTHRQSHFRIKDEPRPKIGKLVDELIRQTI